MGNKIIVEVESNEELSRGVSERPGFSRTGSGKTEKVIGRVETSIASVLSTAANIGVEASAAFKEAFLENPPQSYEIAFGIKLAAEGDVIVAKASTEASFSIKITWAAPPG